MAALLFVVAAAFTVIGLLDDNDTVTTIGWVLWGLGVLAAWLTWPGPWGLRAWAARRGEVAAVRMRAAAEAGDPGAIRGTAALHKLSGEVAEAETWLTRGAEAGDAEAMWDMGRLVEERDGLAASERWFRRAAEHGHRVAPLMFEPGGVFNRDGTAEPPRRA
ncbi:hypothetical protein AB0M43_12140 [Longispora sp. NPDC051575]|uniref:hypothetical protein n=1 Tax=Longispora sp. NPDC051575 TaxID=3154943 RepID=UPI00341D5765